MSKANVDPASEAARGMQTGIRSPKESQGAVRRCDGACAHLGVTGGGSSQLRLESSVGANQVRWRKGQMRIPDGWEGLCKGPVARGVRALRSQEMAFREGGAFLSDGAGEVGGA